MFEFFAGYFLLSACPFALAAPLEAQLFVEYFLLSVYLMWIAMITTSVLMIPVIQIQAASLPLRMVAVMTVFIVQQMIPVLTENALGRQGTAMITSSVQV